VEPTQMGSLETASRYAHISHKLVSAYFRVVPCSPVQGYRRFGGISCCRMRQKRNVRKKWGSEDSLNNTFHF
jgi:hypothetical protein